MNHVERFRAAMKDMSCNLGPMISEKAFEEFLAPY